MKVNAVNVQDCIFNVRNVAYIRRHDHVNGDRFYISIYFSGRQDEYMVLYDTATERDSDFDRFASAMWEA